MFWRFFVEMRNDEQHLRQPDVCAWGARDSLGNRRRSLTQRGTSTKPSVPTVIVLPSLSQSQPVSSNGLDVDGYVKTGNPPYELATRDLADVREPRAIN